MALGRVLGVLNLHGGDILQLDWYGPCLLYVVLRYDEVRSGLGTRWTSKRAVGTVLLSNSVPSSKLACVIDLDCKLWARIRN